MKPITVENVKSCILSCKSMKDILEALGQSYNNGNILTVKQIIIDNDLDISHFYKSPHDIKFLLRDKKTYRLKAKLVKYGKLEYKCSICGINKWLNQDIPLELDHIDGNKYNNDISNLRILCPNCHALTPTYRARNIGKYKK